MGAAAAEKEADDGEQREAAKVKAATAAEELKTLLLERTEAEEAAAVGTDRGCSQRH
jgi:hypothetical protein